VETLMVCGKLHNLHVFTLFIIDAQGDMNLAFTGFLLLNDMEQCCHVLEQSGRFAEATMFAKTHCPMYSLF
jgi:hypothetical protein